MVEEDLVARGIGDPAVLAAMASAPRHAFVAPPHAADAYADRALPLALRQTVSQPYIVALMTEMLAVRPGTRVLEIGTGSGYQTAILAHLGAEVFTVERFEELSLRAEAVLDRLGYGARVTLRVGDGTLGWPEEAPFDRILVTAAGPRLPPSLAGQLAEGGILVMPVGEEREQRLLRATRRDGALTLEQGLAVTFVPLVGAEGYPDDRRR
jgi:protein-L-isoaspartate(D-aspartate) O-methyltransferase